MPLDAYRSPKSPTDLPEEPSVQLRVNVRAKCRPGTTGVHEVLDLLVGSVHAVDCLSLGAVHNARPRARRVDRLVAQQRRRDDDQLGPCRSDPRRVGRLHRVSPFRKRRVAQRDLGIAVRNHRADIEVAGADGDRTARRLEAAAAHVQRATSAGDAEIRRDKPDLGHERDEVVADSDGRCFRSVRVPRATGSGTAPGSG